MNIMFHTLEEITDFAREQGVRMVDFKLTDIDGRWRHLTIPLERLTRDTMESGIGFDGSNYGYASVDNSDMVFVPVLESAVLDNYAAIPTLSMIGDVLVIDHPSNRPFDQYPRNVAKRAVEYMKELGYADRMLIGPEYEFSVFDSMTYRINADEVSVRLYSDESEWSSDMPGSNGYHTLPKQGYHADQPTDIHFDLRNEICEKMMDCGIKVKYHHHEVGGSGQMEIEVELADVCKLADDTMLSKYLIRNVAARQGRTATFMPKPIASEAGNGMHVHMLLKKDGKNIFYEPGNYANLSKTAIFIGGLLKHIDSLCAFCNPSTNSYKRLVPGFEAPVTVGYASANRSAVIRIPSYAKSEDVVRFELRNPDATCNPYFAYAAILMAGIDGIVNKIDPADHNWGPFDFNLYKLSEEEKAKLEHLPATLSQAIEALEKDHDYLTAEGVFSEELINNWIRTIKAEAAEIDKIPHPAEFRLYYDL